jgi:thiol-disulfide isomerase/thioredoxin
MKKLSIFLFVGILSIALAKGQSIKLSKGDEFSFRNSFYQYDDSKNSDNSPAKINELINCNQVNFKVDEVLSHQYKLTVQYEEITNYYREKENNSDHWRSGSNYDKTLKNQYSNMALPEYKVELTLTDKGKVTNAKVISASFGNDKNRRANPDSVLINRIKNITNALFQAFPQKVKTGQTIELNKQKFSVSEINYNQVTLISPEVDNGNEIQIKYDLKKGLLLEHNIFSNTHGVDKSVAYQTSPGERVVTKYKSDIISLSRIHLIANNKQPFTCKYWKNGIEKDTIFTNTNVTIKGKVINPTEDRRVYIYWSETVPNAYNSYYVSTELSSDNTFEMHLPIDNLQKVTFRQQEASSLYLMPGDDINLTVDMKAYDETIHATGIGSDNANYCFKKFLFEEKMGLDIRYIYQKIKDKYINMTPEEFKKYFLDILHTKQDFLNNNKKWMAPEQYLAEFWEIQTSIVEILKEFPRSQEYYRKQANKEPWKIDENIFFDTEFYSLIHPDNAMMRYYDGYDSFIREYVFFFLDRKMNEITGIGNTITVNNFYDNLQYSRYGFANSFFTGFSQHVLKYQTVCDALRQASWDGFASLYNQFKTEYPDAYRTTLLTAAYEKAKKVAPGQPAYNFELSDFNGNKVKLSDFKGKVVYIDFWSTSCGPCRASIERYGKQMEQAFKGTDVVLLYVALEDDLSRPKKFMEEQGIKGIQLIAKGNEELLIRDKYFFNGIPHYYIIDKDGGIVKREAPEPYYIVNDHSILLNALEHN